MFACKPYRRWPPGTRPQPARLQLRTQPSDGGWTCLELTGRPAAQLRSARELVVRRPEELTLAVLAAAPDLVAVVLPERGLLPDPVAAELARRQIATIWRQSPIRPVQPRRAVCAMSRPGSVP
jgi:hypothetical protein